jgi:RNA polymerase sigma-70 factor (ECF subfamily)
MQVSQSDRLALDKFLASVEKRAFYRARLATGNESDALDIVQEAMLTLTKSYALKTEEDWKKLFGRILESRIMDWHRKQSVRNRWQLWLEELNQSTERESDKENTSLAIDDIGDQQALSQLEKLCLERSTKKLTEALTKLPLRQQQSFLLRIWDGLSVKETANVMKCSEGSVKTHLSRAIQSLKDDIKEYPL